MGRVGLVGALGLKVLRVHERIIKPANQKGKKRKKMKGKEQEIKKEKPKSKGRKYWCQ